LTDLTVNLNKTLRSKGGRLRKMALAGWEWIIIAGVLIVFFLWGPNKIPDLARAIGQARREFDKASKEITNPLEAPVSSSSSPGMAIPAPTSADDALISTAKKLNVATEGKTRDEISSEILKKANENKGPAAPAPSA
jgi:sec-independent protein translocase protein TatA